TFPGLAMRALPVEVVADPVRTPLGDVLIQRRPAIVAGRNIPSGVSRFGFLDESELVIHRRKNTRNSAQYFAYFMGAARWFKEWICLAVRTNKRVMAGDVLIGRHQPEFRHLLGAATVGARTSCPESAT